MQEQADAVAGPLARSASATQKQVIVVRPDRILGRDALLGGRGRRRAVHPLVAGELRPLERCMRIWSCSTGQRCRWRSRDNTRRSPSAREVDRDEGVRPDRPRSVGPVWPVAVSLAAPSRTRARLLLSLSASRTPAARPPGSRRLALGDGGDAVGDDNQAGQIQTSRLARACPAIPYLIGHPATLLRAQRHSHGWPGFARHDAEGTTGRRTGYPVWVWVRFCPIPIKDQDTPSSLSARRCRSHSRASAAAAFHAGV